ncbi:MAG: hypothetical protein ABSA92_10640 [Candidatus Bathyarchaeia archaeon]
MVQEPPVTHKTVEMTVQFPSTIRGVSAFMLQGYGRHQVSVTAAKCCGRDGSGFGFGSSEQAIFSLPRRQCGLLLRRGQGIFWAIL